MGKSGDPALGIPGSERAVLDGRRIGNRRQWRRKQMGLAKMKASGGGRQPWRRRNEPACGAGFRAWSGWKLWGLRHRDIEFRRRQQWKRTGQAEMEVPHGGSQPWRR